MNKISSMAIASLAKSIAISLTVFSSAAVYSDWSGEGDVGYNSVSGNSESESLAVGIDGSYSDGNWVHTGELDIYQASQDGVDSAESFAVELQTDYTFSGTAYAYVAARYLDDEFSGYKTQTAVSAGLGKTFLEDGDNLFKAQIGAGYRESEPSDGSEDEKESIFTAEVDYNRQLTDNTVFSSNWQVEAGEENTYAEAGIALRVAMSDALGLKLSYTAKHNTDVPDGTEKTDKYTTVSLNYKFL